MVVRSDDRFTARAIAMNLRLINVKPPSDAGFGQLGLGHVCGVALL